MTPANSSVKLSAQLRDGLRGPEIASNSAIALMCLGFLVRSGTITALTGPALLSRLYSMLACSAAVIVVMVTARRTWLRRSRTTGVNPWLTLSTLIVLALITGWLGLLFHPVPDFELSFLTRTAVAVLWFVAIAVLMDQRTSQLRAVANLLTQQHRLEQVRASYRDSLDRMRGRLAQVVDDEAGTAVRGLIARLRSMLAGSITVEQLASAADQIRAGGVRVVRVLSHDLDKERAESISSAGSFSAIDRRAIRRKGRSDSIRELISEAFNGSQFWPAPITVLSAAGVASVAIPIKGFLVGLGVTAILTSCIWLAAVVGQRFLSGPLSRAPFALSSGVTFVVYAIGAGLGVQIVSQLVTVVQPMTVWLAFSVGLIPMYAGLAVYDATIKSRRRCLEDLSRTLEAISWEVGRLADDELTTRRAVAMLLHGNTQSRIAAVAMKLDQLVYQANSGNQPSQTELHTAVSESAEALEQAVTEIQSIAALEQVGLVSDVYSALESIASSWRSIALVQIDCPTEVANRINESRSIATAVAQTARESITNAIRHGGADRIDIVVRLIGSSVEIRAVDNGRGPDREFSSGLGITAMIRTGGSVRLTNAPTGGGELIVVLPIGL